MYINKFFRNIINFTGGLLGGSLNNVYANKYNKKY